jgi:uncharacterized membrane protein
MEKGKLHGKCPACGVGEKMFEPYSEKIAPLRKLILSLDIHPVLVHFPQAFTVAVFVLSLLAVVVQGGAIRDKIVAAVLVLATILPITVVLAFCAGLLDGKIRFRRVTTPLLKKKMVWGAVFFIFSCGIAAVALTLPVTAATLLFVAALSACALAAASVLGIMGVSLLNAKFPG